MARLMMVKCFMDKDGWRRAVVSEGDLTAVAAYLEQDIQGSLESIALIEEMISKVKEGALDVWEGTGNAFSIQITSEQVQIQCEFEENLSSQLSLEDFCEVLEAWKCLLRTSYSDPHSSAENPSENLEKWSGQRESNPRG